MENWDIRKIVKNCGKYYAHTSSDEKQGRELLEEHAERTKKNIFCCCGMKKMGIVWRINFYEPWWKTARESARMY